MGVTSLSVFTADIVLHLCVYSRYVGVTSLSVFTVDMSA